MLQESHHVISFQTLKEFRDDELHHHDIGLEHDAEKVSNALPVPITRRQNFRLVQIETVCRRQF